MCWWMKNEMECEWRENQSESSSKVSVQKGDSLGRIGLKEKVGFQLFVELRGRQWEERVVGLSRWCGRKSTQMLGQWIPESRCLVVEGSVSNFEPGWIGKTLEGDNCGWTNGMSWLNFKKIQNRRWLFELQWLVCERDNFVLYALCDFEPLEIFEMRSDMIVFRCFSDSTSSRVENKL